MAPTPSNIAKSTAPGFKPDRAEQDKLLQPLEAPSAVRENQEAGSKEDKADLADEVMTVKADRVTYEANLQFLQVQSSLLGTALDMKA
jgi:flagellar basal body rod protein FlgB